MHIETKDFSELLLHYPALSLKLLAINVEKLTKYSSRQLFDDGKVEERVAVYLLDLAKATGRITFPANENERTCCIYRYDPETLSRKFKLLEENGYVKERIEKSGSLIKSS